MALSLIKSASLAVGAGTNVLEQLSMLCDGQNYTVSSGTYTSQNVTALQILTTSYADVTGSTISYTPPTEATCVVYEFCFAAGGYNQNLVISSHKFFIDSDEVVYHRKNVGSNVYQEFQTFRSVIPIGGSADTNTGRQATWTSAKTLKMQARAYSGDADAKLHSTYYWEGAATSHFVIPSLTITALG